MRKDDQTPEEQKRSAERTALILDKIKIGSPHDRIEAKLDLILSQLGIEV